MFIRGLQAFLLTAVLCLSPLRAHDAKLHKGNATPGEIVSIAGSTVVVKTAKATLNVVVDKDTKFEMGDQVVDLSHFKAGDKVTVIGTKLATGELAAKEVVMTMAPAKAKAKAAAHDEAHHDH